MRDIFNTIKNDFKERLPIDEFNIWLSDLNFCRFSDNSLVLTTNSSFKKDRILKTYSNEIKELFSAHIGHNPQFDIEIIISKDENSDQANSENITAGVIPVVSQGEQALQSPIPAVHAGSPASMESAVSLDNDLSFDRFVIHENNKFAYDIAAKAVRNLGIINPIYFYGQVGTGKTHLINAIGNYYRENFPFLKIRYINPNEFVAEYTRALYTKTDRQFRLKYKSLDVLLLDDIQFMMGKQQSNVEFFHIFNEIFQQKKQMVFASDRVPSELQDIHERLKSRLNSSIIVELEPPEKKARIALLKFYLKENNLQLEESICKYIVDNLDADTRKIMGAVKTIVTYRDIYDEKITIEFCKKHLKILNTPRAGSELSPEKLIAAVSNYSKIPVTELKSKKRTKTIAYYRQLLMYILRGHTKLSLPEIGNYLGGKTNATVHFGIANIEKMLKDRPGITDTISKIIKSC